jgi:hypothetical protein
MGETCSRHTRDEKCIQNFGRENVKARDNLGNVGVNRIILSWILKKQGVRILNGFIWIRAGISVNTVINSWVPYNAESLLTG